MENLATWFPEWDVIYLNHGVVFLLNIAVFFAARPMLSLFNYGKDISGQIKLLRAGAVVFFFLHIADLVVYQFFPIYQNYFIRVGYSLAALYGCLLLFNVVSYFSRQKFGIEKTIDDTKVYLETYNSRLVDLIFLILVILVFIYWLIAIWELDGLLQTTGLLGIVFAFLALTNGIWLPDIYHGMVILNSNMLDDGDVIQLNNHPDEHVISRVSFIYTILLDVRNNHRILVRNSEMTRSRIDNLSKRASADGLRHSMLFNIGYPALPPSRQRGKDSAKDSAKEEVPTNNYEHFRNRVQRMFESAFEKLVQNKEAKINEKLPFEVALAASADYALTFRLSYYLQALPNTKVTKTIRQYLVRTPALIQDAVNEAALEYGIALATPMLVSMEGQTKAETTIVGV